MRLFAPPICSGAACRRWLYAMNTSGKRENKGDEPGAAEQSDAPAALAPSEVEAALSAALKHHRAGRLGEAKHIYRQILAAQPDNPDALHLLGILSAQSGDNLRAAALIEKAIGVNPNNAAFHFNLANVYRALGRLPDAIAAYRRALAINPKFAAAHGNLGNTLRARGKPDEAVASYRRALAIDPNDAETHFNLGNALKDQGQLDEAVAAYRRAIAIKPDHDEAHFNYATVHKFVPGDPEIGKLKKLLERKSISEAQRIPLLFALGKAHDDIGLYAEAFSYYRRANEERSSWANFDVSRRRQQIMEIKRVFRARQSSVSEVLELEKNFPIFVVGVSRSAKSLVESLLTQHEDAFAAGQRPEWFKAIKKVLEKHSISASFPDCMDFLVAEQIREMGKTYMKEISKYSPESRFFVNTKPELYLYVGLILQALPYAKMIYCHRDPLDNCLFIYFKRYPSSSPLGFDPIRHLCDLRSIASYYVDYLEMMAHWQKLYGDRIFDVRYEDLVRSPAETGARLYEYCGLEYDPAAVRFAFRTDEIGHWKHYEPYLDPLREALGELTR